MYINRMLKSVIDQRFSHILTVGDFNMNEINWSLCESSENQEHISSVFLEGIKDRFLFQHVREPTRFREVQIPCILELILTNEENMVEKRLSTKFWGIDHVVLSSDFNCFIENVSSSQKSTTLTKEIMSHV